jgi:hypothetical protein
LGYSGCKSDPKALVRKGLAGDIGVLVLSLDTGRAEHLGADSLGCRRRIAEEAVAHVGSHRLLADHMRLDCDYTRADFGHGTVVVEEVRNLAVLGYRMIENSLGLARILVVVLDSHRSQELVSRSSVGRTDLEKSIDHMDLT